MNRQRKLDLLTDKNAIVAELRDHWAEYADDEGILTIAGYVREYRHSAPAIAEAALSALAKAAGSLPEGTEISDNGVEACLECVPTALCSSNAGAVIAGCRLIEEAAHRGPCGGTTILDSVLFPSYVSATGSNGTLTNSNGVGSSSSSSSSGNSGNSNTNNNAPTPSGSIRNRSNSISGGAHRHQHHYANAYLHMPSQQEGEANRTTTTTTTTTSSSSDNSKGRAGRVAVGLVAALNRHRSTDTVQVSVLRALECLESCNDTQHAQEAVQDAGAAASIVHSLEAHPTNVTVQEHGLLALYGAINEGGSTSSATGAAEAETIAGLAVGAMARFPESAGVQAAGCRILARLAQGNGTQQVRIATNGGLEAVVSAMERHAGVSSVQGAGCLAIGYITENNKAAQGTSGRCGAIKAVLNALRTCGNDDADVQSEAFFALGSVTGDNTENIAALSGAGGIEALVAGLGAHGSTERAQRNGCYALLNVSCSPENLGRVCACGGVAAVIRAMYGHLECEDIQEFGCCILGSIARAPGCVAYGVSEIVVEGGIEVIVRAMRRYREVFQIQNLGLFAITYIAGEPNNNNNNINTNNSSNGGNTNNSMARIDEALRRVEECGGVEVITCTVKAYRDIPQAQEVGLALLAKIAEHNGPLCAQKILTGSEVRGAFGTIIGSLKGHLDKEVAVQNMCHLIGIVAKNAREHCHITEASFVANGLEGVTAAMERYPQNPAIQRDALCSLAYISSWSLAFRERVGAQGGVAHTLRAMEAYPADQRLQTYGVQAFAGMAARCPANRSLIGGAGGLCRIAAAMAMHASNEGLQRASCLAISSLLVDSPANRALARAGGCVERIVSAMLAFPDSERLQTLASAALLPLLSPVIDPARRRSSHNNNNNNGSSSKANSVSSKSLKSIGNYGTDKHSSSGAVTEIGANGSTGKDSTSNSSITNEYGNIYHDLEEEKAKEEEEDYEEEEEEEEGEEEEIVDTETMREKREKWLCNPRPGERAALASMARFPGSQTVQEAGCMILSILPQSEGGARDLERVDAVLGAMREHGGACRRVRRCGCAALAAIMARCPECAARICSVPGGIPAIVAAVNTTRTDIAQANGCAVLAGVLHDVYGSHTEMRKCGGIRAIVQAMDRQPGNDALQRAGCKAIAAFTGPLPPQPPQQQQQQQQSQSSLASPSLPLLPVPVKQTTAAAAAATIAGDEDIACVVAAGGIGAVLRAMARNPGDAEVQRLGCKAVARIAESGKGPSGKLCDDAADLATGALGRHTRDAKLQKWACIVLLRLCQLPGGAATRRMAEGGGIGAVLAAMRRTPEDAEVQLWGALALGAAAHSGRECQRKIDAEGGVECVVGDLGRLGDNEKVQRAGCLALAYIAANNPETQRRVGRAGGVTAIVRAMECNPDSEDIQRYGCLALAYTAFGSKDNQALIAGMPHGIEGVVDAMTLFPASKDVQVNGCFALVAATASPELQRRAAAAGGAQAIVQALARFPGARHLQDSGVLGLVRLGTQDPTLRKQAERVVCPDSVAAALPKCVDSEPALAWCVHTLAALALAGRPCQTRQDSLPELLITAATHHTANAALLLDTCMLIGHLVRTAADATARIRNAKGIEALLTVVARPPASAAKAKTGGGTTVELLRAAFFALSAIVREPGGASAQRFVAAHGVDTTVQAIVKYAADEELLASACATLGNAAKVADEIKQRVTERGGVAAIVKAMGAFPKSDCFMARCCRALGAVALGCADAQIVACKYHGIEAVANYMTHTATPEGKESACYALRCLTAGNRITQTHLVSCNGCESVIRTVNAAVAFTTTTTTTTSTTTTTTTAAATANTNNGSNKDKGTMLNNGLLLLMDLAQTTKVAQKQIEDEVDLRALMVFMEGGFGAQEARLWCLRTFACILSAMAPKGWEALDTSAALRTVVAAMDANLGMEQAQHYGCFALATLLKGRIGQALSECALKVGALETAIAAMRRYPDNMKIQNNALYAMATLAAMVAAPPPQQTTAPPQTPSTSSNNTDGEGSVTSPSQPPPPSGSPKKAGKKRATTPATATGSALTLGPAGCLDVTVSAMERFPDFAQIQQLGANVVASAGRNALYNKYILRIAGCTPVLVRALGRHRNEHSVCKSVCAALANLVTDSPQDQLVLADCKGVEAVLSVLVQYPDNRDTQFVCLDVLGHLTVPEALEAFLPSSSQQQRSANATTTTVHTQKNSGSNNSSNSEQINGIQAIISAAVHYASDSCIQREALAALAHAGEFLSVRVRTAIAVGGGVKSAILAMNKFPDSARIQSNGCNIFRFTAGTLLADEAERAFGAAVAAAAKHSADLDVQESAMLALKALADNGAPGPDEGAGAAQRCAAVAVAALGKFPESKGVQEGALAALSTAIVISASPESSATRLCESGAIGLAVGAMTRFPGDLGVQEEACSLLAELVGERSMKSSAVTKEDVKEMCERVAGAMLAFPDSARLQCLGCAVFASLLTLPPVPAAVDAALEALHRHVSNADIAQNACLVLALAAEEKKSELTEDNTNTDNDDDVLCAHVCELCIVEEVVAAMREHPYAKEVQEAACAALCALPARMGVRVALNDGCWAVARAMASFPEEEQLLMDGVKTLGRASAAADLSECLVLQSDGGDLPESPVVVALRAYPGSEALNSAGFALLATILHGTEHVRRVIGSVSFFVDSIGTPALKRYAQNPIVLRSVLDVLAILAEDLSGARTIAGVGGLSLVLAAAAAHPTDASVQELCAAVVARTLASDELHERFMTPELRAAAEAIAARLKDDPAHTKAAEGLLATLDRDETRSSPAQRLFRCATCSAARGACVNVCPKCRREHHAPKHKMVQLFYPAACSCCAKLGCCGCCSPSTAQLKESNEYIFGDLTDYSTAVLSQSIDALLDTLPPLRFFSFGDSLTAAGFRDVEALLAAARETLRKDVVDPTALDLNPDEALAVYVCTHNAPLAGGDDDSAMPITVVNKALHTRNPNALYRVRYLLLCLLAAVRKLPRVEDTEVLYRVVATPTDTLSSSSTSPYSYSSLSSSSSSPSLSTSPFKIPSIAAIAAALSSSSSSSPPATAVSTGKKGDELFQWPCLASAFTDEAVALELAQNIGGTAVVYEIRGPFTAYAAGALTGRRSEVLLELETRFKAVDARLSERPVRICVSAVADPSGTALPVAAQVKGYTELRTGFTPLRGTAISVAATASPSNLTPEKDTLDKTFGELPLGFYATANQALHAAGFERLLGEMHERYMLYVVGSPVSRAFMQEHDLTEEDAAIIFSFTYNDGTENSPCAVVGQALQDPGPQPQQQPQQTTDLSNVERATTPTADSREAFHSSESAPRSGTISLKLNRGMSMHSLQTTPKYANSMSARALSPQEEPSPSKQPQRNKFSLSLRVTKSCAVSVSPPLPQAEIKSPVTLFQGYVLRLLTALRKIPRYSGAEALFVPAECDNLDMHRYVPGMTLIWRPLVTATPSEKEALHILRACKTKKLVLFEVRGAFCGYNVTKLSASPSITGKTITNASA